MTASRRFGLPWLIAAAAVPTVLWQLPYGQYALAPFTVMATWFHEMGHGLTALLLGGRFDQMLLYSDGSGLTSSGPAWGGRVGVALVSAGGLMGPPTAGFFFLLASTRAWSARTAVFLLGGLMVFSSVVWIRTLYGCVAISLIGLAFLLLAFRGSEEVRALMAKLVGVQACIASYRSRGYMFSSEANVGGHAIHSDTANMAKELFLPYWFWGGTLCLASLSLLVLGLYWSTRPARER